jgi:hypothetical protein
MCRSATCTIHAPSRRRRHSRGVALLSVEGADLDISDMNFTADTIRIGRPVPNAFQGSQVSPLARAKFEVTVGLLPWNRSETTLHGRQELDGASSEGR